MELGRAILGPWRRWAAVALLAVAPAAQASCPALLDRSFPRLQDEKPQSLCQYSGKVLLVVNTASFCGYTGQYKALEALHRRYAPRGLVVLGFPSNDFGNQEPGDAKQIADFCENTFGVQFPMFAKSRVAGGAGQNPLFAELARQTNSPPRWNFHKYLVARDGKPVAGFVSDVDPASRDFQQQIERLLEARSPG